MSELSAILFASTLWALVFRASVAILDPGNENNKFATALFFGLVFGFTSAFTGTLLGALLGLVALVALFWTLIRHYGLGTLRVVGVFLFAGSVFTMTELLVSLLPGSVLPRAVVVALPSVVLTGWWVHGRSRGESVPKARAVRAPRADPTSDRESTPPR